MGTKQELKSNQWWGAFVNSGGGCHTAVPIIFTASDHTKPYYYNTKHDFTCNKTGLDVHYGSTTFLSKNYEEVFWFIKGARTLHKIIMNERAGWEKVGKI